MGKNRHPLAGKTVKLNVKVGEKPGRLDEELIGKEYWVEDYWENIAGKSWMMCDGNPACLKYAMRAGFNGLPTDNEVVYGKVGSFGHLVHVSELGETV